MNTFAQWVLMLVILGIIISGIIIYITWCFIASAIRAGVKEGVAAALKETVITTRIITPPQEETAPTQQAQPTN